ncbi:hypothetical protein [Adlercreutzia sp. ZJ473]|uniref:hypothetical protein n=1 Tax=Adlercreutzia sp. ZJ473 TaxID=2722822 RepID=UPI0015560B4A|nr:hypothetical protein [Adlercreutzia sp. ZJ473]
MVGTKLAPPAGSGAKLTTRLLAALMALVLCAGLMPAVPAWAAEPSAAPVTSAAPATPAAAEQTAGTATLTIVKGVSTFDGKANVVVNKTYGFEEGATLGDLFQAAKDAGDIKGFAFKDGGYGPYIDSVTLADGTVAANQADWSASWANYKDGKYADGSACQEGDALTAGACFQFAYVDSFANTAPSDWGALSAKADESKQVVTKAGSVAGNKVKGTATLTVVKGVSTFDGKANVVVNKTYGFEEGATLGDLFQAAKDAGDIKGFAFKDGGHGPYIDSVTLADGTVAANQADWSASWANYKDGKYADGSACQEGDALTAGACFQFAYVDSFANTAPSDWGALSAKAESSQGTAQGEEAVTPSPSTAKVDASALDADLEGVHRTMFANLAAGCAGAGGPSESNVSDWNALSIAAAGQASTANKDAVIAEAQASYDKPDGYNLQRSILALTALGVDATKVPAAKGTIDLVAKLADAASAVDSYPTSAAFTLMAYAAGPYEVPASAVNSAQALLDELAASQEAGGGFASSWGVDTTAMVVPALAAYQGNPLASDMLSRALGAMRSLQQDDGGFGNVNSTAVAAIALCAAGVDPAGEAWATATGNTPLKALLASANEDLTGFVIPQGYSQELADQQGFMALVAYQGLKNTGAAYNVYTQAAKGEAALPSAPNPQDPAADPAAGQTPQESAANPATDPAAQESAAGPAADPAAQAPSAAQATEASSGNALAPTGDDAGTSAGVAAAVLLGAIACAVTARRRASHAARDVVPR